MTREAAVFKEVRTYDQAAKKHLRYQTAICSGCGAFENHPVTGSRAMPPEPLIKLFQRRGWVMGSSRQHDICPACVKDAAKAKNREIAVRPSKFLNGTAHAPPAAGSHPNIPVLITPREAISMVNAVQPPMKEKPVMLKAVETPITPPRQPSREDKRLIILEIENHYLGPDKGYGNGATDETVAKSLNVPTRWVADLREEFFGPLVNPEIGKLNGEVTALITRLDTHEREGREIRSKLNDLKERLVKAMGGAK
jgi:hypothetical protein